MTTPPPAPTTPPSVTLSSDDVAQISTVSVEHIRQMTEHLSQTITANIRDLRHDSAQQRLTQTNVSAISEQCQAIPKCDCLNNEDLNLFAIYIDFS